jgi:hypothetical protein
LASLYPYYVLLNKALFYILSPKIIAVSAFIGGGFSPPMLVIPSNGKFTGEKHKARYLSAPVWRKEVLIAFDDHKNKAKSDKPYAS